MLDAFRGITSSSNKQVQKQTDELELLISTAREERSALSAMLTALRSNDASSGRPNGETRPSLS